MTDLDLDIFTAACSYAQDRKLWLARATDPACGFTRRQCLIRARKLEWCIVNLAISAECRAEHDALGLTRTGGAA